jgi:hypothetical protein
MGRRFAGGAAVRNLYITDPPIATKLQKPKSRTCTTVASKEVTEEERRFAGLCGSPRTGKPWAVPCGTSKCRSSRCSATKAT